MDIEYFTFITNNITVYDMYKTGLRLNQFPSGSNSASHYLWCVAQPDSTHLLSPEVAANCSRRDRYHLQSTLSCLAPGPAERFIATNTLGPAFITGPTAELAHT